tara:strand:+ start:635 stop:2005 length:1371 start_codon:yes stop_codon:yes gene_type:complete
VALQFRLFGTRIRVHLFFVLTILLFWGMQGTEDFRTLPIFAAIVFTGVLAHELGHAFAGRLFGLKPMIDLTAFAGVTRWEKNEPLDPPKNLFISVAGPLVGITLGGLAAVAWYFLKPPEDSVLEFTMEWLVFVNLGWSLLNLVPILPLDGGNAMASIFQMFSKEHGLRFARYASLAFIIGAVVVLLLTGIAQSALFLLIFLGLFGWMNLQALRFEKRMRDQGARTVQGPEDVLKVGYEALEKGDGKLVLQCASILVRNSEDPAIRDEAHHLAAWGFLLEGIPGRAREALDNLSGERDPDPALEGAVQLALGRASEALGLFETALRQAPSRFVEKRYLQAVEGAAAYDRGLAFFEAQPDALSPTGAHRLLGAAFGAGDFDVARRLGIALHERSGDAVAAFNVACCEARLGHEEEALRWLERARLAGFQDLDILDRDEDLSAVRDLPGWSELRARYEA